jgi:hypothetical protein
MLTNSFLWCGVNNPADHGAKCTSSNWHHRLTTSSLTLVGVYLTGGCRSLNAEARKKNILTQFFQYVISTNTQQLIASYSDDFRQHW